MAFYTENELMMLGVRKVGKNVKISTNCSLYGADRMAFGDNVRIDDFSILTGDIIVGSYVHIAAYTFISAWKEFVIIDDFVNISSRVNIFSCSDDFSGVTMTSPLIPDEYKNVISDRVHLKKHTIVGVNSVIMPGVVAGEGTAIGAISYVTKSTIPWTIYCGIPATAIRKREKKILDLERKFIHSMKK